MHFGWVTINVQNLQASVEFYTGVLDMQVKRRMQPKPGTEIVFLGFAGNGTEIELIHNAQHQAPKHGQDLSLGFGVPSLDGHLDRLRAKGLSWTGPFQPAPAIKFIYTTDPDGVKIQFFEAASA